VSTEIGRVVTVAGPQPVLMTYEQFLTQYDGEHAEWVGGEVVAMSPTSDRHTDLVRFLVALFSWVVEADELGVVRLEPFQMRLREPIDRSRAPDVLFLAREHLDRLRPTYLDGPADLVVEITSPESVGRDRGEKFVEYEAAGIPEYWLIDPARQQAEFYLLGSDGRYRLALGGATGEYASQMLPGLRMQVEWLWHEPLPKLRDVLRQLDLL
jgi:Uma2 family endonuclease